MMGELIYVMLAGLVGLGIGMFVMHLMHKKQTGNQSVQELESKLQDYQDQVETHFAKTADLIDNLTNSYKDVFEHLSESAEQLLTEEQINKQLQNRNDREVTIKYLKSKDAGDVQPPPAGLVE